MKILALVLLLLASTADATVLYEASGKVTWSDNAIRTSRGDVITVSGPRQQVLFQIAIENYTAGEQFFDKTVNMFMLGTRFDALGSFAGQMPVDEGYGNLNSLDGGTWRLTVLGDSFEAMMEGGCADSRIFEMGNCLGFTMGGEVGPFRRVDQWSSVLVIPEPNAALLAALSLGVVGLRRRVS